MTTSDKLTEEQFDGVDSLLYGTHAASYKTYDGNYNEAKAVGWKYFFEGVPVTRAVYEFCREFKTKRPHYVYYPSRKTASVQSSIGAIYNIHAGVTIAHKDSPTEIIASIWGNQDGISVASRNIQNQKYSRYGSEYYTKFSKDPKRAFKTALQFIRPMSMAELVDEFGPAIRSARSQLREAYTDFKSRVGRVQNDNWERELMNMMVIGYEPVTQEVRERLEELKQYNDTFKETRNYNPKEVYVRVGNGFVDYLQDDNHTRVDSIEQLPDEMQERINVLQITSKGDPGMVRVGARVSNNMFVLYM